MAVSEVLGKMATTIGWVTIFLADDKGPAFGIPLYQHRSKGL